MKNINDIEVIIVSHPSSADEAKLVKWMATTLQSIINKQIKQTKDMFFGTLNDAPAFHFS